VEPLAANRDGLAALLFLAAGTNALDVFSATNSSPWTAENFGADEEKVASLRRYVRHAIVITTAMSLAASLIAGSWWPILGAIAASAYMWWLYEQAVARGRRAGSQGWVGA
jgi:hypothetical protein